MKSDSYPDLKSITQVPPHLAFNKYVLYGYRVNYSLLECLKSLFFLHNETVNVYTHVFMVLFALNAFPRSIPGQVLEELSPVLVALHLFACVCPFIASTSYHLFMCHRKGPTIYRTLLSLDVIGIWITNTFGFIIPIWAIAKCQFVTGMSFLSLYLSMSCVILYYILTARESKERAVPLALFTAARLSILTFRYVNAGAFDDQSSLWYYFLADLIASVGATINVIRLPERLMPGLFDYFLNSHQLMHLFVMHGTWSLNKAALKDLTWMMESTQC